MDWIDENIGLLQLAVAGLNAAIWLFYLHLFLTSFRRQQETVILINRGASEDERARCIVSNMGSEPVYILSVVAEVFIDGEDCAAHVTDREELDLDSFDDSCGAPRKGP